MNKIVVENDTMRFYSTPVPIPVGGSQWSKIFFMFSDEWEDLRKIAQFRQGELKRNVDIASNNFCYVPNEMLPDMCGELSIVGYPQDTASAVVATANSLMLNFVQGFESGGDPAVPPTPDLYQKLLKEFAESGGGGVQPDWNQNDSTQPDYIKNRPFYTGDPVETVLLEESTVTFFDDGGVYMAELTSTFEATVGETYKVYWDGAAYECACVNFNNRPFIGNLSIIGAGSDTGEPFIMGILNGVGIQIVTADTSASHTISISGIVAPITKIDEKYLPDSIISDISTAQSTANAAQSTANTAQTAAENARSTANTAKTAAENAQTAAENAQTTANNAKTRANNAQATAREAQTTASKAQTTANNAKSEALDLAARMFGHTSVVDKAFYDDETLSITSLPACIESIGDYAFTRCKNLALTSLPSGITSIGVNAFQGCKNLALTSLPSGLTSIGDYVFSGCNSLALTSLPSGLTSIGDYAFNGCFNLALTSLPSGLTSIGVSAFGGCRKLALTSLPSGLTSIGSQVFSGCNNLALTSLPSGLTSIGDYAFNDCKNLALTSLPSGLTSIGVNAFSGCTGLTSITFTGKPTTINSAAFEGCTNLTTINVPWAEGEVANAPWGATNATINYNYTEA